MCGKVSAYAQRGMQAAKGGIAMGHRLYAHGLGAAGAADTMWKTAKRIGNIISPHLEMYGGGKAIADGARAVGGNVDALRSQAISRHADVRDRMQDHSRALQAVRQEIPTNFIAQ